MTPDEFQAFLDKLFPRGATAQLRPDYTRYVPRVMVVGVKGSEAMLFLGDVLEIDPPLYVVVTLPKAEATEPLRLDTDDENVSASTLTLTAQFPKTYEEDRQRALASGWYKLEGEETPRG